MNAALVETGEEYAYVYYRYRGQYPTNAIKVIARDIKRSKDYSWDKKRKTSVLIEHPETGRTEWVSSRNLVDRWEDYEGERRHILQEQSARYNAQLRTQIRERIIEQVIKGTMTARGWPATAEVSYDQHHEILTITMDSLAAQSLLNMTTSQIDELVEKAMANRDERRNC